MPKVEITNKKGLVQSAGGGDVVLKDGGLDLRESLKTQAAGGSFALKAVSSDANVNAANALIDFAGAIPADSVVIAVKIEVLTAVAQAAEACTITKIGLDGDDDAFASGLSLDAETAGTKDIFGAGPVDTGAGFAFASAADTARVTLSHTPDDAVGKLRLTVFYFQLS